MSVNTTVSVTSTRSGIRNPSSGRMLLRPHRCDNCMSASLPNHPPYCDPSCFENYSLDLNSACRSPTSQQNANPCRDYVTCDITVAGIEFGCSTCAKYTEALGFASSLTSYANQTEGMVSALDFEGTNWPASVLKPFGSSLYHNPAKCPPSASRSDPNALVVGNLFDDASLLLEEPETNKQTDLHELSSDEGMSLLDYRDFILYEEPDWLYDLEPLLSERACATPQSKDDNETMSDDDNIYYCRYCWPFLVQDGAGQQGSLWNGEREGKEVASAA